MPLVLAPPPDEPLSFQPIKPSNLNWVQALDHKMDTLECSVKSAESFHPTLHISVPVEEIQTYLDSGCSANAFLVLPPLAFVDPYELANYEEFYTFRHWGPSNLELPTMAMPPENSTVMLDIHVPHEARKVDLHLPIHLRYEELAKYSSPGYHIARVDCPTGFIACPNSGSSGPRSTSSQDANPHLPTEVSSLFDARGMTLLPMPMAARALTGSISTFSIRVPVGNPSDIAYVEAGTALTIIICFLYLSHTFLSAARRMGARKQGEKDE